MDEFDLKREDIRARKLESQARLNTAMEETQTMSKFFTIVEAHKKKRGESSNKSSNPATREDELVLDDKVIAQLMGIGNKMFVSKQRTLALITAEISDFDAQEEALNLIERVCERLGEQMSEELGERICEKVSEKVNKLVSDKSKESDA
jgi:hypothetical protein